jgi:hypothetical protein
MGILDEIRESVEDVQEKEKDLDGQVQEFDLVQLGKAFDSQYATLKDYIKNFSKKQLIRVITASAGDPIHTDVKLIGSDENAARDLIVNLKQLQINMMMATVTELHEKETENFVSEEAKKMLKENEEKSK